MYFKVLDLHRCLLHFRNCEDIRVAIRSGTEANAKTDKEIQVSALLSSFLTDDSSAFFFFDPGE